jgi:hypothetical protein
MRRRELILSLAVSAAATLPIVPAVVASSPEERVREHFAALADALNEISQRRATGGS